MTHNPLTYRYFLLTVDPVHIGTGGTRLGRVDMSIVREPGTNLPKIPGTSLSGAIRAYAAHRYGKPQCAGQGQQEGRKHCGRPTCPICYTFGTASESGKSYAGVVAIGDARILLFPVYSMVGPVWVTSPGALQDAGFEEYLVSSDKAKWPNSLMEKSYLNLGWLMVEQDADGSPWNPESLFKDKVPEQIRNRVVLVSDKLFSQIVNSNLEVRTSVSINPKTGAAEEGALFTYEAIPRATVLWMDVVVDDYREAFPTKARWKQLCQNINEALPKEMPPSETTSEDPLRKLGYIPKRPTRNKDEAEDEFKKRQSEYWKQVRKAHEACKGALEKLQWDTPADIVSLGLEWVEHLGVGGMGTRGFGRLKSLVRCNVDAQGAVKCAKEDSLTNGATEK